MHLLLLGLLMAGVIYLSLAIVRKSRQGGNLWGIALFLSICSAVMFMMLLAYNTKMWPIFIITIIFHIFIGWVTYLIAESKGRRGGLWFILGFFFAFIPLIVLYFIRDVKQCPKCKEYVDRDAEVCRYCGNPFFRSQPAKLLMFKS